VPEKSLLSVWKDTFNNCFTYYYDLNSIATTVDLDEDEDEDDNEMDFIGD
jgi:hypothetical protein